jgi:hypothetical protein
MWEGEVARLRRGLEGFLVLFSAGVLDLGCEVSVANVRVPPV